MLGFNRNNSRIPRKTKRAIKTIQATEGVSRKVILESLLTASVVNLSVPGTTNAFKTYDSQVAETYQKYNGNADFGNAQTRAVIDIRAAVIAGDGISVSCEDDATADWIEKFLDDNALQGENFIEAVKGSELAGQSLMVLASELNKQDEVYVRVKRIPYSTIRPYRPSYVDKYIRDDIAFMQKKVNDKWERFDLGNYTYVRTGGDDYDSLGPTTKVGTVLTDIENYDRAVRDIRRLNHILARITPTFKTASAQETTSLTNWLSGQNWTIGKAFVGTAEMTYQTADSGAHNNLVIELVTTIKNISATTGVPVHWLGYVDLMSNRSTAESLYELLKHATVLERVKWEKAMYDLIYDAQVLYIDGGGTGLSLNPDFQVQLPLIDFSQFLERVKALSLAYADDAIALSDYRNQLPGIDPLKTARAVEAEQSETIDQLVRVGQVQTPNNIGDIEDGE